MTETWEKGIVELDFEYINKFELIKKSHEIVDVFVEYDDIVTELADLYIDLRKQLRHADKEGYFAVMHAYKYYGCNAILLSIRVKRIIRNFHLFLRPVLW